jgi:hypothetical protein
MGSSASGGPVVDEPILRMGAPLSVATLKAFS